MSQDIVTPIVHLNGTSKAMLLEELDGAYRALDDALCAMAQAAPNGRDYYPEPGRMEKAVAQHERRMRTIRDLRDELEREVGMIEGWRD